MFIIFSYERYENRWLINKANHNCEKYAINYCMSFKELKIFGKVACDFFNFQYRVIRQYIDCVSANLCKSFVRGPSYGNYQSAV